MIMDLGNRSVTDLPLSHVKKKQQQVFTFVAQLYKVVMIM